MKSYRAILLAPLLVILVLAAAACGGDDKSDNQTSSAGNGRSLTSGKALEVVDLANTAQALVDLKSFRFELSMKLQLPQDLTTGNGGDSGAAFAAALLGLLSDIKAKGSVVAPDQTEVSVSVAGQEFGYVQIGKEAWEKTGSAWKATTPSSGQFDFSPSDILKNFLPDEVLKGAKTSRESVNGASATRYSYDKAAIEKLTKDLGQTTADFGDVSEANLDLWLTDAGVPVKLSVAIAGKDAKGQKISLSLELNVHDINDASIKIKPPI